MMYRLFFIACLATFSITATNAQSSNRILMPPTDHNQAHPDTSAKMNVYFLSGLGADERVFVNLKLDETRFNVMHIKWIAPGKMESLHDYASRLMAQMDTTRPFQLVGLSFGGIMASVISEIARPAQIILISSTPTGIPISRFYQNFLKFILFHPLSGPILKSANSVVYRYFGADTPEMKALLKQILKDTDTRFLKWALVRISSWDHAIKAPDLYHIHGTADRLIPIKLVTPDIKIQDGGHLMVYKQHEQISELLNTRLRMAYELSKN